MWCQTSGFFCHKLNTDGSLARYKARWVVRGFTQQQGVDYEKTFSPVIKLATIWVVLSLAISKDWPIHQLDVKNAFLHGNLSETVYAHKPAGFISPSHSGIVFKLNKSLYGLKHAPRTWFLWFASFLSRLGFRGPNLTPLCLCFIVVPPWHTFSYMSTTSY
jgi:hypothetical protein